MRTYIEHLLQRKYVLVLDKHYGQNKLQHGVPVVLYRRNKKFYVKHGVTTDCLLYAWQAWLWYYVIGLLGKRFGQKLFAYKKVTGFIRVVKVYGKNR
ncbi:hypothetical protein IQ13_3218 [Lacibacter cauensis]|uniref:Uncharacterized protein n=1 Tax=Lacibacter cauensis TaxID=510947 RepID=A0A562SIH3_9BACT|nr:hypothetical protein [Lacibacter cauensis]TWI80540.1 hypothetical protein IQ13_3218 [Lacibacter cauensis]